jgi:hypothetical protein
MILTFAEPKDFWGLVVLVAAVVVVLLFCAIGYRADARRADKVIAALGQLDPALVDAFQGDYYGMPDGEINWDKVLRLAALQRDQRRAAANDAELAAALATLKNARQEAGE